MFIYSWKVCSQEDVMSTNSHAIHFSCIIDAHRFNQPSPQSCSIQNAQKLLKSDFERIKDY